MLWTIELPPRAQQLALNEQRWMEILRDPKLAQLPHRMETDRNGYIIMSPPASGEHSRQQGEIIFQLRSRFGGIALPECPISTLDGVKAADVGWYSEGRFSEVVGKPVFPIAPEICVEVLSPCNTKSEMTEKKELYFEAGAQEVWFCKPDGTLEFFERSAPETSVRNSTKFPTFPADIGPAR